MACHDQTHFLCHLWANQQMFCGTTRYSEGACVVHFFFHCASDTDRLCTVSAARTCPRSCRIVSCHTMAPQAPLVHTQPPATNDQMFARGLLSATDNACGADYAYDSKHGVGQRAELLLLLCSLTRYFTKSRLFIRSHHVRPLEHQQQPRSITILGTIQKTCAACLAKRGGVQWIG